MSFVATYGLTWKLYLYYVMEDWAGRERTIGEMKVHFVKGIPVASNLVWNVVMFVWMQAILIHWANFSPAFEQFCGLTVLLPCLLGSLSYYCFKYGIHAVATALVDGSTLMGWIHNWLAMQGPTMVALTHSSLFYVAGIVLQPYVLPPQWDFSLQFPKDLYEEYLTLCVYWFAALTLFCLITLPLSKQGYHVAMTAAGRHNITISYLEAFMELIYQSAQGTSILFTIIPLVVILQDYCQFRVYTLHMIMTAIEIAKYNYPVNHKFCITHQMMHEIQPLCQMTHIEHHVCKGIYPTSPAAGLWENWVFGHSIFVTQLVGMAPVPYSFLQGMYMGANLVVHTMWPHPKLLQWHTLHHTILADVYSVNNPSDYDKDHSQSVKVLHAKLQAVSPFVRYEFLPEFLATVLVVTCGLVMHYGLGLGLGHVDWAGRVNWEYYREDEINTTSSSSYDVLWNSTMAYAQRSFSWAVSSSV
ncbi:expressed unknown protein [Seminavis robusta]|uniref:Fatty acid hydroxylase domain-containing protein n=1 Tax=Seminavis robusta TaxID=568900 RepID=A0A9N8HUE9_9STRA|nr:expressed unknown protein [Seminavis robusta]|eukprot:Sro1646_g288310.1 n/a (471) ;mRNA; r:12258-13670